MNSKISNRLRNITAENLSQLEIHCDMLDRDLSIKTQIFTRAGSFSRLIGIAMGYGEGSVFLLSQDRTEHIEKHILDVLAMEEVVVKRIGGSVALSLDFASAILKVVPQNAKVIFACGGGLICDLAKIVASELDLPLCFIPSAPSSDGMLSDFAVVGYGGGIERVQAKAPEYVVCDSSVCGDIPPVLVRSGFGDCVANYLSVFDWMIAKDFYDEEFSPAVSVLAITSANKALHAGEVYLRDRELGVEMLFDALLLSSGAMSLLKSNTPCCGAEHSVAMARDKLDTENKMTHGESVFFAFCKLVEVYRLFFASYAKGKYLPPDTEARCDFLISHFGVSEDRAESMCKVPIDPDKYKIFQEKFRVCKPKYAPQIQKLARRLPKMKSVFFSIYSDDIEKFNMANKEINRAIAIAPDVEDKNTTLSIMREFGVLDALLV